MTEYTTVLVADLDGTVAGLTPALRAHGLKVTGCEGAAAAVAALKVEDPDILLVVGGGATAATVINAAAPDTLTGAARVLVCVGDVGTAPKESIICQTADPQVIARRVADLRRIVTMQQELATRLVTQDSFGIDALPPDLRNLRTGKPFAIVTGFHGTGDPLNGIADVEFEAAPAAALGRVQREDCDLLVIGPDLSQPEVERLIDDIRHFPNRYHLPVLWIHDDALTPADGYVPGVGLVDLAPASAALAVLAERVTYMSGLDQRRRALQGQYRMVASPMIRDTLTGLFGHGFFMNHLTSQILKSAERGSPLSVAVFTLDNLDAVNCAAGYAAGDRILAQVGSMVGALVRAEDTAGRLSGACFAVSLPGTPATTTLRVLDRVASVVKYTALGSSDPSVPELHVGFGCADMVPGDNASTLIARAHAARRQDNQPVPDRA